MKTEKMYLEKTKSSVAIIIPLYNDEKGISDVIKKIKETGEYYDILVINDKSTERT